MEDNLFYVAQKAFIKKDNKVLILIKSNGNIDFPGGQIQVGEEDLSGSLRRETKEETGLDIKINKPFFTWTFTLPETHKNAGNKVFVVGYECEYVDGDINISNEHINHRWVSIDEYKDLKVNKNIWFEALSEYFRSI